MIAVTAMAAVLIKCQCNDDCRCEIDVERAKLAKSRAESHLEDDDDNTDINRAKRALERANNRLRVAELQ